VTDLRVTFSPVSYKTFILQNLASLQELLSPNPDALAELSQHVHLPLRTAMDDDQLYICCSWNRLPDGTYRSPYHDDNNKLQAHANELWNTYKQMYYGNGAVGSVYVSTGQNNVTSMCFLLQNKQAEVGEWNSAHIVHVSPNTSTRTTTIDIQSHVLVLIGTEISAHVSKHTTTTKTNVISAHYMEVIGPMLESVETELRSSLENVQLPKTRDVCTQVRRKNVPMIKTPGMNHTDILNQAVLARAAMQKKG